MTLAGITHEWSFPPGGNVLYKPLDSGLRRNDDKSNKHISARRAIMCRTNRWIPRSSFQTRLYHLGGLFPTPLYHLHPCRRASMQAGLRRSDEGAAVRFSSRMTKGFSG